MILGKLFNLSVPHLVHTENGVGDKRGITLVSL